MSTTSDQKPSPMVPFFLGVVALASGIHLFAPEASDTPELVLSGVLISLGVIFFGLALRNFFYKPDENTLKVAERKATAPFIERRKGRGERRASATRRWINERRGHLDGRRGPDRREQAYDRRTMPDRRVNRRKAQKWDDPSVLHPVKPDTY